MPFAFLRQIFDEDRMIRLKNMEKGSAFHSLCWTILQTILDFKWLLFENFFVFSYNDNV